jgi:large repetitive protein
MGGTGNANFGAFVPAVSYNAADHQYQVVWYGDDNTGGLVDGESEIYGQALAGATVMEIGTDTRLSDMGPDGSFFFGAFVPAVAYNPKDNQYLVVWMGDDNTGELVDDEYEIFGQRFAGTNLTNVPVIIRQ